MRWVADDDSVSRYNIAAGLVISTLAEGVRLPEAMACGCHALERGAVFHWGQSPRQTAGTG